MFARFALSSSAALGVGVFLLLVLLAGTAPGRAQQAASGDVRPAVEGGLTVEQGALRGILRGRVTDSNGMGLAGARVVLRMEGSESDPEKTTDEDGSFAFEVTGRGAYRLSIEAPGFAPAIKTGVWAGQGVDGLVVVSLRTTATETSVEVKATREEIAAAQVEQAETQRALGMFPNYYVVYAWDAPPMTTKQKFGMAWKTTMDPVSLMLTAGVAGVEQAQDDFSGFGQGAAGYGKRYGAAFADETISTFLSSAVLPTVFRQDPRYFYRGTGTIRSRALYALESAVVCRSDRGRWEPNYSNVLGNLATGAISNLYYPAANRNGAALTFENGLLGTAAAAAGNVIQEFVLRRFTTHANP